jgi:predicted transposase/invertase (TIGR01784 family)
MTELMKRIFSDTDENHRKQKEFRLPAIIPIVLYNGTRPWSAVNEFKKYLNNYEVFGDNIINFKYLLIDLNSTDKNYLLKTNTLIDNVFALDKTQSTEQLKENLKVVVKRLRNLSSDEQVALINWIKVILMKKVQDKNEINAVIELIKEGKVDNMTYAIERVLDKEIKSARKMGKEEGKLEGKQEGREEGKQEGRLEIAQRLLSMGFTIEQIILATALSQDQILNLKNQE